MREAATALQIELVLLPGYSPDFMPVEALWRWLREDVTYHHSHRTAEDLSRRVAAFEARLNQDPCTVADRLWVKDRLDPEGEKLPRLIHRGGRKLAPIPRLPFASNGRTRLSASAHASPFG